MSDNTSPLKVTLKAGASYEAPWVSIDATDPGDLSFKLKSIIESDLTALIIEASNVLQATRNVFPLAAPSTPASVPAAAPAPAAPVSNGWGAAAAQQQNVPAPAQQNGVLVHPTDRCPLDNLQVQYKKTPPRKSDGKSFEFWVCPNQSSKDDGHYSEFYN